MVHDPDCITEKQKEAIEKLAHGGYKCMELDFDTDEHMHATFIHLNGDCSLVTLAINTDGLIVKEPVTA